MAIETEMTDCLQEMAKLQAKMEHLQQEKNNKAAEEVVKEQEVEPNLKVMSDWLDEYGKIIDEVERERVIEEQYKMLLNGQLVHKCKCYEFLMSLGDSPEEIRLKHREARNLNIDLRFGGDISQLRIKYEPTEEEYELYTNQEVFKEKYLSLQAKKQSTKSNRTYYSSCDRACSMGQPQQLSRAQLLHNSRKFHDHQPHPTYFMKQYIEATHNMFLIQQKRIDELENMINGNSSINKN